MRETNFAKVMKRIFTSRKCGRKTAVARERPEGEDQGAGRPGDYPTGLTGRSATGRSRSVAASRRPGGAATYSSSGSNWLPR